MLLCITNIIINKSFFSYLINHFIIYRLDELEIQNQSFKIDSVVSHYSTNEFDLHKYDDSILDSATNTSLISEITNENLIKIPVLPVNEYCWYSKPIVMNLTTQQIFFQLSTENNGMRLNNFSFYQFNEK